MTNQYADETLVTTANIVARLIDDGETIVGHDAVSSASVARVLGISRKAAQDRLTACPDVTTVDGLDPETLQVTKGWMFVTDLNPTDTIDRGRGVETDGGRDQSTGDIEHPRQHELPNGGLVVVDEFRGHVRHAVTVSPADRPLYELLIETLAEADTKVRGCFAANVATAFETLPVAERGLRDIDRGGTGIGDRWYGMSITLSAARAIAEYRDRDPLRLAAVGCSGSKYEDNEPMPAKDRYKGAYWSNKRDYGEIQDDWRIISAEHDVLHPETPIDYYERTPDDWRGVPVHADARLPSGDTVETRLDQWALDVYEGLSKWMTSVTDDVDPRDIELEVLLGRDYREPLEDRSVFDALRADGDLTVTFPFQEVEQAQGGMFEQIDWMGDEVEAATEAVTDGGRSVDTDIDRGDGVETDGGTVTARVPELPDFQRDILLILARSGPTHGQGLVDDLGALRDETINHGRLYPNLDKLAGKGLVEKSIRATDGRTNEYDLTIAGRAALRNHAGRLDDAISTLDGGES